MRQRSGSVARLFTVVILLASWVVTGHAQTQGGVTGTLTDSSGAPIPGASVTLTNTATRGTRETTTNLEGLYTFPSLPPGNYELKIELQGFKTAEVSAFKVDIQQTVRRDVVMEVGRLEETVTVSTDATLLNTESTTVGTVIENKVVTELPLNGRQYLNLVAVAPNVNLLSPSAGQAGARLGGERRSSRSPPVVNASSSTTTRSTGSTTRIRTSTTTSPCRPSMRSRSSRSRQASIRPSTGTRARR